MSLCIIHIKYNYHEIFHSLAMSILVLASYAGLQNLGLGMRGLPSVKSKGKAL